MNECLIRGKLWLGPEIISTRGLVCLLNNLLRATKNQMITIFTHLCSARGQLGAKTTEVENNVHNLVDRANLTPPCPNGCKAAISDAVSIGLFPGSESNVFSSFSLPPFPTIRKYSSILSSSQPPNHQRTPPKLTPRTHRYLIRYLRSAAR